MKEKIYESLACEIPIAIKCHYVEKAEEGKEKLWMVEGYASMEGADRNDPVIIISREAMKNSEDDLKENSTVFLEHQRSERIGKVLDSKVDRKGLWVKILISKTAKDVWKLIQEGVLNALSIGARILESIKKIDREMGELVEVVTKMEILEVSLVGLPAHPDTKIINWREEALQPICNYFYKAIQNHEIEERGDTKMTIEEIKAEAESEESEEKEEPEKAKVSAVAKIKEAIGILEKAVEAIEGYYYKKPKKKYPKPDEEYEEDEKKKKPKEEYEEYYKEEKKTLEELKKSIEELSRKIIGEDRVKEMAEKITKDVIKKLPEPEDIRKGLEIKKKEESEALNHPRKRLGRDIEEMVGIKN